MASSIDAILCGICMVQDVTKHADKWCPECDEGLCFDCEKHHRISKASRHHATISIEDYKSLPKEISKIDHNCEVHGRKFQMYCPTHDQPCCPLCVSEYHDTCTRLLAIDDVVKNAKTSSLLETIEQTLHDSEKNIETIIKDREQNLLKIKNQRREIQERINETRDQVNTHLDNLERKIKTELDAAEETVTSDIEQLLQKLKAKSQDVKQLQKNLVAIKSHASDLQTFLGSKQLETQTNQEDNYIRCLAEAESLKTIDVNFTLNGEINKISSVSTFGSVTIEKGPTPVSIRNKKDKQAQILSSLRVYSGSIDDVQTTLIRRFILLKGENSTCLTGCAVFPDGKIAFADCNYNKRIVITKDCGTLQSEISMSPCSPFDVTCLDNNSIAFTNYNARNIQIINNVSQNTTQTITTNASSDGITNKQGTLIFCERGEGITLHQLDKTSSNTTVRENVPYYTYIAVNETNIYHTDNTSGTVACYNLQGVKIWDFKDESILKIPRGVAVDRHFNVYVASNGSNSIVVISPDGQKGRELLKEKDGIKNPWGLAIDKEKGNLIVTCFRGAILLCKLNT